jgi:hypothetical protein
MSGGYAFHSELVKEYPSVAKEKSDEELREFLSAYSEAGTGHSRQFLDSVDHRVWRRLVIQEALKRGLIDRDPCDAP